MEQQINYIAKELNVPVKMAGITPAREICWFEAVIFLREKNGMGTMSVSELRKKVTNHIEKSPNFDNVIEMAFNNNKEVVM